jgi:hypothetical protein
MARARQIFIRGTEEKRGGGSEEGKGAARRGAGDRFNDKE